MTHQIDPAHIEQAPLLGVNIHVLTVDRLHGALRYLIERRQKSLVLHVNVHAFNLAQRQPWLIPFWNAAAIVFCDGAGVVLGARLLGHHLPTRITYADWMWQLAEFAAAQGYNFYFVGGRPGVAAAAAGNLRERWPSLQILGVEHGYFDKATDGAANQAVIARINAARPDILIVGFGMPLQERWLRDNWQTIDATVALTAGAVFDYISGDLRRAPDWMTDNSLEWLGRLIIEPRRLWRRYVVGNPQFLLRVLRQRLQR